MISDTGSTDNTIQVFQKEAAKYNITGTVLQHKWKNFGHNRQLALEAAVLTEADYLLFIDADELLEHQGRPKLDHPVGYNIKKKTKDHEHVVPHLINVGENNRVGWRWEGVVHNYLVADNKEMVKRCGIGLLQDVSILVPVEGASGKTDGRCLKDKYLHDAAMLEEVLKEDCNDSRSRFYLAQSYRDAGMVELAVENYKKRAEMGGWVEEVYVSRMMCGGLLERLGRWDEAKEQHLGAQKVMSGRLESWFFLMSHYYRLGTAVENFNGTKCN